MDEVASTEGRPPLGVWLAFYLVNWPVPEQWLGWAETTINSHLWPKVEAAKLLFVALGASAIIGLRVDQGAAWAGLLAGIFFLIIIIVSGRLREFALRTQRRGQQNTLRIAGMIVTLVSIVLIVREGWNRTLLLLAALGLCLNVLSVYLPKRLDRPS